VTPHRYDLGVRDINGRLRAAEAHLAAVAGTPLLAVNRRTANGTSLEHVLFRDDDNVHGVINEDGKTRWLPGARTASDALRRSSTLHTAHPDQETRYRILDPQSMSEDQVLDAIRPVGEPDEDLDWTSRGSELFEVFDDGHLIWSTRHRIAVNTQPVYAVADQRGKYPKASRRAAVVPAEDYRRPYDSWDELLAMAWDSSDYSSVGMAGYGVEGVYLIRPGLLGFVSATDESLDISIQQVSRTASRRTIASRCIDTATFTDRMFPHLVLAAYGFTAADLYPGDSLSCGLATADLQRILPPPSLDECR